MTRREVFVDTSALVAVVNQTDALHARAVSVQESLRAEGARMVTSDWVLAELLGGSSRRSLRRATVSLARLYVSSGEALVLPATRTEWRRAFEMMAARTDKDWSFTDCASIIACQRRGIERVFSHDRHFTQAGLQVLL